MYEILGLKNVFSTFQETVWSHLKKCAVTSLPCLRRSSCKSITAYINNKSKILLKYSEKRSNVRTKALHQRQTSQHIYVSYTLYYKRPFMQLTISTIAYVQVFIKHTFNQNRKTTPVCVALLIFHGVLDSCTPRGESIRTCYSFWSLPQFHLNIAKQL